MAKITNHQTAPSKGVSYVVVPFTAPEIAVYKACLSIERAAWEVDNRRADVATAVRAMFGDETPTYAQYRDLQEAVRLQSVQAGFTGQAMRKHVAAAVKTAYGKLPESDSPAAIAKAKARAAGKPKADKAAAQTDTLAAGNATGGHVPTLGAETIESFIARVGMTAALAAAMRILDAVDETKAEAAVIGSVIANLQKAA